MTDKEKVKSAYDMTDEEVAKDAARHKQWREDVGLAS